MKSKEKFLNHLYKKRKNVYKAMGEIPKKDQHPNNGVWACLNNELNNINSLIQKYED